MLWGRNKRMAAVVSPPLDVTVTSATSDPVDLHSSTSESVSNNRRSVREVIHLSKTTASVQDLLHEHVDKNKDGEITAREIVETVLEGQAQKRKASLFVSLFGVTFMTMVLFAATIVGFTAVIFQVSAPVTHL
jgi:hypothetical protein